MFLCGCFTRGYPWFAFTLSGFTHNGVTVTDKEAKPAPSVTLADRGRSSQRQEEVQKRSVHMSERDGELREKQPRNDPTRQQKGKTPKQTEGEGWMEGCCEEKEGEGGKRGKGGSEKEAGGGWISLVCTGSRRGPKRPLQASTMSDHISIAASSFPSSHTCTLTCTHTHTNATTWKIYIHVCVCTKLEKCLHELLFLNLNLSPLLSCNPCGSISQ